jgi:hypothetical protein
MRTLLTVVAALALAGCTATGPDGEHPLGEAPLRGFGVDVDQAVSARVPTVHLKTCGTWGCHEQDVALSISGPTSAAPCGSPSGPPETPACGPVHLSGPGPGYGYAPVPALTTEPVTVVVTTPAGAPLPLDAEVRVRPHLVCPGDATAGSAGPTCAGGAPQAQLRIAADGTVSQTR